MAKSLVRALATTLARPIPFQSPQFRGGMLSGSVNADKLAQLQAMGATGTLYSIIQLLSTGVSAHPWQMFRKNTDGRVRYASTDVGSDQRVEVLQHQALRLWNNPNPFMTGEDFREIGWQFMELVGEWYWVLNRGPSGTGLPTEIWPVRPDRMEPVPDKDKFLAGWVYTGPNGEKVPLSTDEVIQLKYPNPTDFYRGLSPVQALMADLDSARYSAQWSRNFFLNSATPGGIVQFSKRLQQEEYDEFVTRWREQHQGIARGHRVGVLEQGATWFPNTYTLRDMQFIQLRTMSREIMREAYRIHGAMLGLTDQINKANAQTAQEVHVGWQEVPRLRRMRSVLNNRFLAMFGASTVEFDFPNPQPQSQENAIAELNSKSVAASTLVTAGWDPAEVLLVVGLPEMKFRGPAASQALPGGRQVSMPPVDPTDAGAPMIQKDLWADFDDAEIMAISAMIRDAFKMRAHNGHRKELVR
jgi:HK97 family phage portal protein